MNRVSLLAASVPKPCIRRLTTTAVRAKKPDLGKLRELQGLFQQDNGLPVYLKAGQRDTILYYITLGVTFAAVGSAFYSIYELTTKK